MRDRHDIGKPGAALFAALIAASLAGTPLQAAGSALNLDQGVNIRTLTQELRGAARQAANDAPMSSSSADFATRDCATFSFGPGAAGSDAAQSLVSRVFRTVCRETHEREYCEDELLRTETRSVSFAFSNTRAPLPWETEAFVACLEGSEIDVDVAKAAHKYKLSQRVRGNDVMILAFVEKKIPTAPDPKGIAVASFAQDPAGGLLLTLSDKWAEQYRGESTVLRVQLKRDHPNWFDRTLSKAEFAMPAAGTYAIPFDKVAGIEPGGRYYASWSFRREGKISKDDTVEAGQTPRVAYK